MDPATYFYASHLIAGD